MEAVFALPTGKVSAMIRTGEFVTILTQPPFQRSKNKTKEKNRMNRHMTTRALTQGAVIAALYVALTYIASLLGLSSGVIQIRLSEALCVLPIFLPAAIPGLYIGCLLANILTGCVALDILMGPIATLIGTVGTYLLRRHPRLALLPPILSNAIIVPVVLRYGYGMGDAMWYMVLTAGIGAATSVGILGSLLFTALHRRALAL